MYCEFPIPIMSLYMQYNYSKAIIIIISMLEQVTTWSFLIRGHYATLNYEALS